MVQLIINFWKMLVFFLVNVLDRRDHWLIKNTNSFSDTSFKTIQYCTFALIFEVSFFKSKYLHNKTDCYKDFGYSHLSNKRAASLIDFSFFAPHACSFSPLLADTFWPLNSLKVNFFDLVINGKNIRLY